MMTRPQHKELVSKLKAECALRGCPISVKIHTAVNSQYARVLPGKRAQHRCPEDSYPVFGGIYLQILREEAIALGFTHVRGLAIDPQQYIAAIQEELHFPVCL